MLKNGNMSAIRASFMLTFEKWYGSRPEKVTRKDLDEFMSKVPPGFVGPSGQAIKYPSWLTNGDTYRSGRGSYAMPWDDLDAFLKINPSVTPATALRKNEAKAKTKSKKETPAQEQQGTDMAEEEAPVETT